ncbi:MAG: hypothetical protein M3Y87_08870 [Myxococcota bacterium]|nr:hypothetical protein [Myxococcota bacterium]
MKISRFALVLARLTAALALAAIPFSGASLARADDPEPEVSSEEAAATPRDIWDRLLAVELIGGIDTPWGVFGGAVVISPVRYLALDVGGGISRDGGRVAGGARLVLPHANGSFGLRVGFAGGPLSWERPVPGTGTNIPGEVGSPERTARRTWEFVGFVDVSVNLEIRLDAGVYFRFLFGVEHALSGADSCVESTADGAVGFCARGSFQPVRTYVGLALGYAFDI